MSAGEIVAKILRARGISEAELGDFLNPSLDQLARPEELPGVEAAADAVLAAMAAGRKVVVFGDYDCDGVCATAILVKALGALGANVEPFLPSRLTEGYGMSDASVARLLAEQPDVGLVVTVDNGINSIDQIAALRSRGVDVVVTDHHLPTRLPGKDGAPGEVVLPDATALVNPKVAAPAHLADLCGAGVSFLLANRLISEAGRRGMYSGEKVGGPLLVLAGIATVTDLMPLLGQNRILVAEALKRFAAWAPMGVRELYARAARAGAERLTSRDFGFLIGPRINASGRLGSGEQALELVLSDDREISRELARIVDMRNMERRSIEQKMSEDALARVVEGASAQVIDLPEGHPGVVGIVAARLLERIGRGPVCVIAGGHGSGRAPDGFNLRDAFDACAPVLERYGGHAAAGGFSVKEGMTDEFRRLLCEYCDRVDRERPPAVAGGVEPDIWIEPKDVSLELADEVARLEPFGEGNPEPTFGLRGVTLSDVRPLGSDGRHLTLSLRESRLRGVFWNHGDMVEDLRASPVRRDLVFALTVSDYGERHVELRLVAVS